jgi:3-hydroxyacyl-CoA dehydrogenase/enoyl-CoA hydratase/3-hydroxybutyryl-CoA epimerase
MTTQSVETKRELTIVKRSSGVALILFDSAGKFNSLGSRVLKELDECLDVIERDNSIKAIIAISGKHDSFIIGADLHEIKKASGFEEIHALSKNGQRLFNRVSCYGKPFITAVNGSCLGGGLELALSAHARVLSNSPKTILGLPETRLGLIPGLGGTQRLPRMIGLKAALDMILSASIISAAEAKELGIVDKLVSPDDLIEEAEALALSLAGSAEFQEKTRKFADELKMDEASVKATPFCLTDLAPEKAEKLLAISERAIKLRTKGNYPAQTEVLAVIKKGLFNGMAKGLELEAETFARLAGSDVAANLISLFFNTDLAKGTGQALIQKHQGAEVKRVGILGGGTMGTTIAQLSANTGIETTLKTRKGREAELEQTLQSLHRAAAKGKSDDQAGHSQVSVTASEEALSKSDLVIECVFEDTLLKAQILSGLKEVLNEKCVVVSNTSALSITELAKSAPNPERFLGVHFFHPVDRMPLVELIPHTGTSKEALARAMDFVLKLDKTPIVVKDKPGFLINRLLTVYLFELARLAEEKTPLNWVEDSMLEFGMPLGPLTLMDEIGIDVAFTVAKVLEEGLGARMQSPEIFRKVTAIGLRGKRSNVGFYLWEAQEKRLGINQDMLDKTGAIVSSEKCPEDEKARITDRMLFVMLDEAARCLEEKVVARPREIDYALILGVGFPAFRGGLLKYADKCGLSSVANTLEKIYAHTLAAGSSGERNISPLLKKYASEGRGFYSLAGKEE